MGCCGDLWLSALSLGLSACGGAAAGAALACHPTPSEDGKLGPGCQASPQKPWEGLPWPRLPIRPQGAGEGAPHPTPGVQGAVGEPASPSSASGKGSPCIILIAAF